jgi:hypothetical protein
MLDGLRDEMAKHRIATVEVHEGRWPAVVTENEALARELPVDVSLIAHVGYDVESIGPFLDAMERATRRECVAILMQRSPASLVEPFWPPIHGEPRIALPALPAFVDLLRARGRAPRVDMVESRRRTWASRDELEPFVRRQTWVAAGTEKDRKMQRLLDEWLVERPDGTVDLSIAERLAVGLVSWQPGAPG